MSGKVAFIGLGAMGSAMARRLAEAGLALQVWNRTPEKSEALAAEAVVPAASPAEAVSGCSIACLCLKDADAIEAVLIGPGGIAEAIDPQAIIVDLSTTSPTAARNLAARSGARWLDCPVSGGVAGAQAGNLAIFVGGRRQDLEMAAPLLGHLGSRITHMGRVGAGQAAKLCNQLIVASNFLAIAEAMALGERLGIDIAALPDAFAGGFADSRPLTLFGPRMAPPCDPGPAVSEIAIMRKDIAAIRREAGSAGMRLPLMDAVERLYDAAAPFEREDLPSLMKLYRGKRENAEIE